MPDGDLNGWFDVIAEQGQRRRVREEERKRILAEALKDVDHKPYRQRVRRLIELSDNGWITSSEFMVMLREYDARG